MSTVAIIDIETTGFKTEQDSIVEIGIVELNLISGEIKTLFNSLVYDDNFKDSCEKAWIFENSDLKFYDVTIAPTLKSLKPTLQGILDNHFITAFNKSFDLRFLKARELNPHMEYECIMLIATDILQIPGKKGKYKWPSVQQAWNMLYPDMPYIEKHRALDDAHHEAQILMRLLEINNQGGIE